MLIARLILAARGRSVATGLAMLSVAVGAPSIARGQRPDTVRVPTFTQIKSLGDWVKSPISPRRALVYSFLMPGSSQTVLGRNKAAAGFLLVEAISLVMIRESAADVHEARRSANDTLVTSYVDGSGNPVISRAVPRFGSAEIKTREAHVEDWVALLIANHLFAGADGFVAAQLWDVKARLGVSALPRGGAALVATLTW